MNSHQNLCVLAVWGKAVDIWEDSRAKPRTSWLFPHRKFRCCSARLAKEFGSNMAHTMKIPEPAEPKCTAVVLARLAVHPPAPVDPVKQNRLSAPLVLIRYIVGRSLVRSYSCQAKTHCGLVSTCPSDRRTSPHDNQSPTSSDTPSTREHRLLASPERNPTNFQFGGRNVCVNPFLSIVATQSP